MNYEYIAKIPNSVCVEKTDLQVIRSLMRTLCLYCCFSEGEEDDGIRIQYLLYQQLVLVYLSQRSENGRSQPNITMSANI